MEEIPSLKIPFAGVIMRNSMEFTILERVSQAELMVLAMAHVLCRAVKKMPTRT